MKAIVVKNCRECPHKRYESGGLYSCLKAEAMFSMVGVPELPPAWCPLPDWPARRINELEAQVRELKKGSSNGN